MPWWFCINWKWASGISFLELRRAKVRVCVCVSSVMRCSSHAVKPLGSQAWKPPLTISLRWLWHSSLFVEPIDPINKSLFTSSGDAFPPWRRYWLIMSHHHKWGVCPMRESSSSGWNKLTITGREESPTRSLSLCRLAKAFLCLAFYLLAFPLRAH